MSRVSAGMSADRPDRRRLLMAAVQTTRWGLFRKRKKVYAKSSRLLGEAAGAPFSAAAPQIVSQPGGDKYCSRLGSASWLRSRASARVADPRLATEC